MVNRVRYRPYGNAEFLSVQHCNPSMSGDADGASGLRSLVDGNNGSSKMGTVITAT